jgi:hypothetical protein
VAVGDPEADGVAPDGEPEGFARTEERELPAFS